MRTESAVIRLLPVLLVAAFVLLLPFTRLAEIPFSLLALSAPWLLWQQRARLANDPALRRCLRLLLWLTIAFCLPMLLSSIDSVAASKSWNQSLAALRFPLYAMSCLLLLRERWAFQLLLSLLALIIGFWVIDGLVQTITGTSLLGFPANPSRLGGIFGDDIWFFGPILAMLSPLLLERLWPLRWRGWFMLGLLATMLVVVLAGMRAGWVLLPLLLLIYAWRYLQLAQTGQWRRLLFSAAVMAAILLIAASQSQLVQQRWQSSLVVLQADSDHLQIATTQRWMIWQTAVRMSAAHPINGVGVRAFAQAYPSYADADDPQLQQQDGKLRGARHAHLFLLEALTDCGGLGLLGLLAFMGLLLRSWQQADALARQQAMPYFLSLLLILFPLNTHYSLYGTFMSSLIWWLLALAISALHVKRT